VSGIPHVQFNGTEESIGGGTNMYPYYLDIYNQLINDESPIEIGLIGYLSGDDGIDLVVDVILTDDVQPGNNKIIFILTYKYGDEYFCTVEKYYEEAFNLSYSDEVGTYEHYFELESNWNIENVSGLVLIQNLSGNRQIYQSSMTQDFQDPIVTMAFMFPEGWTTVGLPLIVSNSNYQSVFPDAIENTLYSFDDGYSLETNLENGEGYWIRFPEQGFSNFVGLEFEEITITINEGWNMISGVSEATSIYSIFDPYDLIVPNTIYNFVNGYNLADDLEPGQGYWLRSNGYGDIMISVNGDNNNLPRLVDRTNDLNIIRINDKLLYFGGDIPEEELLSYSLPPVPPQDALDVRYIDNMRYSRDGGVINLKGMDKLSISYHVLNNEIWKLFNAETGAAYTLKEKGKLDISNFGDLFNLRRTRQ
tara:strand:+ start:320 stop:1579 length:1260 start_codon:yes stop_codon:yes gene_type:complete